MSTSIDNRVVGLQFDNKNFEKNVGRTLNSLDKLEASLQLKGAGRGLEQLDKAASKMDFSKMGRATELITKRLSTMGIVGMRYLEHLSDKAIQTGEQMLKAFTIQPISDGFSEYELKMGSVQTIVASTGESLSTVNAYLEELNKYSDKTIYSFKDMTASIGKFTNAGVPLEQAVLAIQGISNEAAVSGANAEEASRAMYNFSQALSAGYVKLIDWKSIENANMATREFKQELINTAVAMGTLTEANDGMYKAGKTTMNATKNFNDSLQEQWMTSEVLIETLRRYADETTDIGKKAFAAAQDIKTFHQLIDTIKESIGSGWAQISEIIFGDLEEAKKLWTSIGNAMSDFVEKAFGGVTEFLNKNLQSNYKKFMRSGALADVEKFNKDYKDAVDEINKPLKDEIDANNKIIQSREASLNEWDKYDKRLKEMSENNGYYKNDNGYWSRYLPEPKAIEHSASEVERLVKRNEELGKQMADDTIKSDVFKNTLLKQYDEVSDEAIRLQKLGYSRSEAFKKMGISREEFNTMMKWRNGIRDGSIDIEALVASFDETARREKIFKSLGNTFKFVGSMFKPFSTAFKNVFFNADKDELWLGKLIDRWDKWSSGLKISEGTMKSVTGAFERMFGWAYKLGDWALPKLKSGLSKIYDISKKVIKNSYNFIAALIDYIDPIKQLDTAYTWIIDKTEKFKESLKNLFIDMKNSSRLGPYIKAFEKIKNGFMDVFNTRFSKNDDGTETSLNVVERLVNAVKELPRLFEESFGESGITLKEFVDNVKGWLDEAGTASDNFFTGVWGNVVWFATEAKNKFKSFAGWVKDNLGIIISGAYVTLMSYRILKFVSFLDNILGSVDDFILVIDRIPKAIQNAIKKLSNAASFKMRAEGIKAFADALLSVAKAIAVISAAIWAISKLEPGELNQGLVVVGVIIIALGILGEAMSHIGDFKGAVAIASMAGILIAVAFAADLITKIKIDENTIWGTLDLMIGMLVGIGLVYYALTKMPEASYDSVKMAVSLAASVFALYAVILAVKLISEINFSGDIKSILFKLGVAFGALFLLMEIMKRGSKDAGKAGAGLLAMSLSIILLIAAFKIIENIDGETIAKGVMSLTIMMIPLKKFMKAIGKTGPDSHKAAAAILAIGLAIIPLAFAAKLLGSMDLRSLAKGVGALVLIMFSIGLVLGMGKQFNASFKSMIGIIAVIATLGVIVGGLAVLAHFVGWEAVIAGAGSLVATLIALGVAFKLMSTSTSDSWKGVGKFVVQIALMGAVAAGLAFLIYKLANIPNPDVAIKMAITFGALLAEFALVFALCAGLGTVAPVALNGLLALDAVILNFGVILGAFAALETYFPGTTAFFETGIPLLSAIGRGIGEFVGGIGEGLMNSAERMSETLIKFCENVGKAFGNLKDVPPNLGTTITSIAGAMIALTASEFVNAIGDMLGLEFDLSGLPDQLSSLGAAIKAMAESLDGVDNMTVIKVRTAAEAATELLPLVKQLSDKKFLGFGKDYKADSGKLKNFGGAIKAFAGALSGIASDKVKIDSKKITAIAKGGTELAKMAEAVPNGGGKMAEWFGDNEIDTFGTKIVTFANSLNNIPAITVTSDTISKITTAGEDLADMAKKIPGIGGIWQTIWGDDDPATFGQNIESYVSSLAMIDDYKIATENFENFKIATYTLSDIANSVSSADLTNMEEYQTKLSGFIDWTRTLTLDGSDTITPVISTILSDMIDVIDAYGGKFHREGKSSMREYRNGINSMRSTVVSMAEGVAKAASNALGSESIKSSAFTSGDNVTQGFINGILNNKQGVWNAGSLIGRKVIDGINFGAGNGSPSKKARKSGRFVDEGFIIGLNSMSDNVYASSYDVGTTSIQAMSDAIADMSTVVNSDIELQPTIRPVMDLSEVESGSKRIDAIYNNRQVRAIAADRRSIDSANYDRANSSDTSGDVKVSYVQNNYSPKALSRIDIYRQTKNQISQMSTVKGVVKRV